MSHSDIPNPNVPVSLETASDLADVIVEVQARRKAEAIVPPHLADWIADSELIVTADRGGLYLER